MICIADVVGIISDKIQRLLGCTIPGDEKIYLGQSNIAHMKARHWEDYQKYGSCISEILRLPDYIGRNPTDDSIEYVKEFNKCSKNSPTSSGGEMNCTSEHICSKKSL